MGFGTFGRTDEAGIKAILYALELGYCHLDTAQSYDTEREVGAAVRRSGLARGDVFITTKIGGDNCRGGKLIDSLKRSNDAIGISAVDLALIHWPVDPGGELPMETYLPELAKAQDSGLCRLIGVSNFTIADLEEAGKLLGSGRIATNQFERHPLLRNDRLVDYCSSRDIAVTCYLPLARGACSAVPVIETIARKYGATPHQIALAMSLGEGHVVIPTSGRHDRIKQNWEAHNLTLDAVDLEALRGADRNERQIDPSWSPAWD